MALTKKGRYWYGSGPDDTRAELLRYSKANACPATRFAESVCACGHRAFRLETDEDAGAARRTCLACGTVQLMGDSAEFADEAEFGGHECVCAAESFELLSGVALYSDSSDVRWYYLGCRCTACNLVGVFADWKCEAGDAEAFLAAV
ncbi:hypothetical protein GmRootV59_31560 [Variovorax sp. V59]|jgi:hypothetical protein|uniref:Ferredoxin-like protein FixX n=1 Tax=Variovorax paradoxus TaxID=34073 RepID=A0AAE4BZQ4_VARPD|nr:MULTISPECIES: hypothetical protein [Variovorax]MBD9664263.1 hypothetical protein [Variovorax sp. VRV01]MDP9965206.1 ferredoxin-like protein FixX [Variovorax paradoxus]MDR6428359.1 ferredoxin-like protein FixX [Variovorax paradoxus]MDR6455012.1 ferredoxin-like protein FixX [Variovorax paradoxus]